MGRQSDYKRVDEEEVELQDFNKSADLDNSIDAISPKPSRVPLKIKHVPTEGDNKSSTIKTVITIFISFVGAGILGLPYAFLRSGYVMGTVCIAAVSIISLHCMLLLLECKHRLEDRGVSTYSEVASACLGQNFKQATEVLLVVSQTGFCVAYLIFVADNLGPFSGASKAFHVLLLVPFLISLAMLPSLTALAPVSTAANLCNIIGMVVVLWDDLASFQHHETVVPFTSVANLPFMFGVSIYCFEGIGMILPIEASMADRKKFPNVLFCTVAAISIVFITFGLMGYIAFGPNTHDIVTLNLPKHWSSTMMIFAVCTALVFTFPVMMVPVYEIIEKNLASREWFEKSIPPGSFGFVFRVLRAVVVLIVAFVAISVPAFGDFISLIGSLCCAILAFVVPSACHLSLLKDELNWRQRYTNMLLIGFGLFAAVFGTYDSILSMYG